FEDLVRPVEVIDPERDDRNQDYEGDPAWFADRPLPTCRSGGCRRRRRLYDLRWLLIDARRVRIRLVLRSRRLRPGRTGVLRFAHRNPLPFSVLRPAAVLR